MSDAIVIDGTKMLSRVVGGIYMVGTQRRCDACWAIASTVPVQNMMIDEEENEEEEKMTDEEDEEDEEG